MIIQYWEPMITQYGEYGDIPKIPKSHKKQMVISLGPRNPQSWFLVHSMLNFAGKSKDHLQGP